MSRPPADRERVQVVGLAGHREPVERLVEPLADEPLQRLVAPGAPAAELLEVAVSPDDSARKQHRSTRSVPLLVDENVHTELTQACRGHKTRHPRSENRDQRSEKLDLCS